MNEHPRISENLVLKPGLKLQRFSQTFVLFSGSLLFSCLNGIPAIQAQIIPDATLPVNSTVTPQGNINQINGGTQAGGNLFHSFQEFSIPTGSEAFFNNSLDIQNIFSRVTGNSISNIDGLIRANGFANLFLLNPNGIVFGPNAQLNLGGSFLASTANRVNFADGTALSTLPSETPPLLTVSIPIGLQMGANPGKIVVQGPGNNISQDPDSQLLLRENRPIGLGVQEQTLALVSADIEVNGGNLTSKGGGIELGSVGDNSTVSLNPTNNGWDLGYSEVTDFRDIHLNASASLDASGEGSGRIHIQSRNLSLSEGSAILSFTEGNQPGQNLTIRTTEAIELSGSNPLEFASSVVTGVDVGGSNNAGNLTVETAQLTLTNGSSIGSFGFGQGNSGDLTVWATKSVTLSGLDESGSPSGLATVVLSGATGDAGNLTIETAQLTLNYGSLIATSTLGQGNAGDLTIRATESVTLSGLRGDGRGSVLGTTVEAGSTGDAGSLTVETGRLTLNDGARISTSTFGQGNAGTLSISATEFVTLSGLDGKGTPSFLQTAVSGGARGNAGNLTVETGKLTLFDGAQIESSTFGEGNAGDLSIYASESVTLSGLDPLGNFSLIKTEVGSAAIGNAGNLTVETGRLTFTDGGLISASTFGEGNAGNLTIRATESVELSGLDGNGIGSVLRTQVFPRAIGDAGNLTVETGRLTLTDGAFISSSTRGQGNAGNLSVRATESVTLSGLRGDGTSSFLETAVYSGAIGNAGNLLIETTQLTLTDGARMESSSVGQGNAGTLSIRATESVTLSGLRGDGRGSVLSTTVESEATGGAGNLTVETGRLTLNDGARITTSTFGQGNAGSLSVRATESVTLSGLDGNATSSFFETGVDGGATGDAGNLTVETNELTLSDGAFISSSTFGQGNAGSLSIRASESVTLSGLRGDGRGSVLSTTVESEATGDAGNLIVETGRLTLNNGARITTSTFGQGNAGSLSVRATESVTLSGLDSGGRGSTLESLVSLEAIGDAGSLTIETAQLSLNDGAEITTSTLGQGNAGNLTVRATESVTLSGLDDNGFGSILQTTVSSEAIGDAGSLTIETAQLSLNDGAEITTSTLGQGNAGAITIETAELTLNDGSGISTSTFGEGNAGNLTVRATESVTLSGLDNNGFGSSLRTTVGLGAIGNAGNLTIETAQLTLNDDARITTSTLGQGNAGSITIETAELTLNDGSGIFTSTFGEGNAGNLTVHATESVTLSGVDDNGFGSSLRTTVSSEAIGDAGNLTIETPQLSLNDGTRITTSTLGQGNAGSITIETAELTLNDGSGISTSTFGEGNAGALSVRATESVTLSGRDGNGIGSSLQTRVSLEAIGDAGSLTIETAQLTLNDDAEITTSTLGQGNAGAITIETAELTLNDGSDISTSTFGEGNAGNLTARATESVTLSGLDDNEFGSILETIVGLEAIGDAGSLTIETAQLTLNDDAEITTSTLGQGNAGAITLETAELTLNDGSRISTSTLGQGNAGALSVRATESVTLSGLDDNGFGSSLQTLVSLEAIGDAGNLTIETANLTLNDGASIDSSTFGQGNAGDLTVRATESVVLRGLNRDGFSSGISTLIGSEATGNAGQVTLETTHLTLMDGARISASIFGVGNAGNLTIRATESLTLSGFDSEGFRSNLQTEVRAGATGNAGNLIIETGRLTLLDGARISSETLGNGNAGNVSVRADEVTLRDGARISVSAIGDFSPGVLRVNTDRLFLDTQSSITAETQSGSQGNIEISADSLIMRRNSNITTNATGPATGGNINITTGVLAALENSNINANSEQAQGGTVTIDAQAIFGTEFRESSTSNSDITATGADSSLSGTVSINTPEIDPTSGLVELPTTLTDVAQQIDSSCRPGQQQSEFIVTGRGGLPPNPIEAISDEATWLDLRPGIAGVLSGGNGQTSSVADASNPVVSSPTPPLVEAQGWVVNAQGKMELVAQGSEVTLQNRTVTPSACIAN
jgi:filamentous hemagglutinin family protein